MLTSQQDTETEDDEVFLVVLIASRGGASISDPGSVATLTSRSLDAGIIFLNAVYRPQVMLYCYTVLKSDNANGLFGFDGLCQPFPTREEGQMYSCAIKRERGDSGSVSLSWRVDRLHPNGSRCSAAEDFHSAEGVAQFTAGQLRSVSY